MIQRAFEANGLGKSADHQVLNTVTALSMVRAGFGITIAPLVALPELNMRGLIYRRLRAPRPVREICLCRHVDHTLSPAADQFRQLLRSVAPRNSDHLQPL